MTPTEMLMMRQQMMGPRRQSGGLGSAQAAQAPAPPMPMPSPLQSRASQGQSGPQFGGPNASPLSRLFPEMGMPAGVPSNVAITPMASGPGSGTEGGRFLNGQRDLPAMRAMGK